VGKRGAATGEENATVVAVYKKKGSNDSGISLLSVVGKVLLSVIRSLNKDHWEG